MAGLEGIDASAMEIVDALGARRFVYDPGDRVARPLLRHADRAPVAVHVDGERVVDAVRFGMPVAGGRLVTNARDDRLAIAPAWKGLLAAPQSRGLAAISYVVERDRASGHAFRIQRRDGKLMVVPALVARRRYRFASTGNQYDDLGHVQVTAAANAFVASIHDRFVVELETGAEQDEWMGSEDVPALLGLLSVAPVDRYEMVPIAPDVWKRRDDPAAVAPVGPPRVWGQDRPGGQTALW